MISMLIDDLTAYQINDLISKHKLYLDYFKKDEIVRIVIDKNYYYAHTENDKYKKALPYCLNVYIDDSDILDCFTQAVSDFFNKKWSHFVLNDKNEFIIFNTYDGEINEKFTINVDNLLTLLGNEDFYYVVKNYIKKYNNYQLFR